ncbi:MAG TPA: hypothetical protein VNE19_08140 [Methylomirabilota bacterium]|nr:hypothetical protein [Methylomirabilota bacterium]
MKRALATAALIAILVALLGGPAVAASAVPVRTQLRGHLPELGERPTMRVFVTQAEYDTYRNSLGEANVFPAAGSLFMSFDKDVLALYTRGNDPGGRCIGTQITATSSGDTVSATAPWQAGTCGAPSTAHYPFVLVAFSRTATDGTAWLPSTKSVCLSVESQDTNACASLTGASPAPSATAAATTPPPTATSSPGASATAAPTATRSLTPSQTVAVASPTPTATSAPASATASRSPVAAASPPVTAADNGTNYLLYAMLIAIGFLILLSLVLSRGGRRR